MDDALRVRAFKGVANLPRDRKNFVERKGTVLETLGQVFALDEFHRERHAIRLLFEAVDLCDVRMIQRGERSRLALESRETFGTFREFFWKQLQRNIAIEPDVASAVDL